MTDLEYLLSDAHTVSHCGILRSIRLLNSTHGFFVLRGHTTQDHALNET